MIPAMPDSHAWLQPAILIGLDVAAKSLLLLAIGLVTAAVLGRKQLLTRSALWNACVLGLLILPITSISLPRLRIPILPATTVVESAPASTVAPTDVVIAPQTVEEFQPAMPESSEPMAQEPASPSPVPDSPKEIDWVLISLLIYAGGGALLGLRLMLAALAVHQLRLSGCVVYDPLWQDTLKSWISRLGINTPVELLHSTRISVPVAFGWLRPTVMIPAGMIEAPISARRSCILLHELAHVRRRDYMWQLLLKLAQVLYWPNPLIWLAGRLIAFNREEATDALCVYHATNPSEYRLTLLEVAQSLVRRPAAALGIAMARTPRIAQRLERIDRGQRVSNCLAGRPIRSALTLGAIVTAGVVGACQLAAKEAAAPPQDPGASIAQSPTTQPTRTRCFVLLVVGKDKLTFEGRPTTWEEVPKLLEQVPNRPTTVFETAVATDEMTLREVNDASSRAAAIARKFDFEYLSDTGVKALGSKGDPPQQVPAPTARTETPLAPSGAPAATPGPTQPTARVRLESGAEVELLGIHALASGNAWWAQKWWGLDGQPLKDAPCDDSEARFSPDHPVGWAATRKDSLKETREYLFAARMTGPKGTLESPEVLPVYTWRIEGARFRSGDELKRGGRGVPGNRIMHAAISTSQGDTTQVRIGVGTGKWETRGVSKGETPTTPNDGVSVEFSAATEKQGVTTLFVTDHKRERAQRILAIDHDGQTHVAKSDNMWGNGESLKIEATFPGLPLKQIKEFQFQTMDYEWATFNRVPLHPGQFVAPDKPATLSASRRAALSKETTPEGMRGLMAPTAASPGAKQLPERRVVTQATGPKATLKSGGIVEFLGVHALPQKDGWWTLDGRPLKEDPCDPGEPRYWDVKKKGDTVTYPPDVREYQFVFRVTGPEGKAEGFPTLIPWVNEVPGAKSTFASAFVNRKGQAMSGFRSVQATLPSYRESARLLIGLVAGNWKTQGTSDGNLGGTSGQGSDVLFSAGAEIQGNATISVTSNKSDNATRIIAIDRNDETHETPGISSVSGEMSRVTQAIFPNLPLKEVKEFRFQTCEYEWVSFSDIPLKPGTRDPKVSATGSTKSIIRLGGHVNRPGVYALEPASELTVQDLLASAGGTDVDPQKAVLRIERKHKINPSQLTNLTHETIDRNPMSSVMDSPLATLDLQPDDLVHVLTAKEAAQTPAGTATRPASNLGG